MGAKIDTEKGWTEAFIEEDCGFDRFYHSAAILEKKFDAQFTFKLDDFDSLYWGFNYKGSDLVLHYSIFFGVSIFPKAFTHASSVDNVNVIEIGDLLVERINEG